MGQAILDVVRDLLLRTTTTPETCVTPVVLGGCCIVVCIFGACVGCFSGCCFERLCKWDRVIKVLEVVLHPTRERDRRPLGKYRD